ncbi:MAG: mechanosensitive ion channel family protein [Crocinitomicaceae bacterium]
MTNTLFQLGPFIISFLNIMLVIGIYVAAFILKKVVMQMARGYLKSKGITLGSRQTTWFNLIGQSFYIGALYFSVMSFKFNNPEITFKDFLNYKLIDNDGFKLDFYRILVLISVFYSAKILVNILRLIIVQRLKKRKNYSLATEFVYVQLSKYIIYLFAIIIWFKTLGIDLTILLTGSAALLVGLGLGLQDVFKDIISGIVLLFEGNIRVGDIVEINGNGSSSKNPGEHMVVKILKINIRTTEIETREGNILFIPNTRLTQDIIENWSHGSEKSRFKIEVTVNYGVNTEKIIQLLQSAAMSHPHVNKNEQILVRLAKFGDNGLEFELLFWADQSWDINNYRSEIRLEINRLFQENNIEIPYPKRSIEVFNK